MGNVCKCELDDNLDQMVAERPSVIKRRNLNKFRPNSTKTLMTTTTKAETEGPDSLNNSIGHNLVKSIKFDLKE